LDVGKNFPRAVIYLRTKVVGFELIKLKIVIAILAIKFHIRNIRAEIEIIC